MQLNIELDREQLETLKKLIDDAPTYMAQDLYDLEEVVDDALNELYYDDLMNRYDEIKRRLKEDDI